MENHPFLIGKPSINGQFSMEIPQNQAMGFEKNEAMRALKGGTMEQAVEVRGQASDYSRPGRHRKNNGKIHHLSVW